MKTEQIKKLWEAYVEVSEKKEDDFKPHMMYDPETGKAYKAEKPEDHVRMKKMGYTHEKPKMDEKKLDPVDDKALDKKFKDRKDKDIDNDGDVDSSDEYLHKRRKAVDKAIERDKSKKEEEGEDKEEEEKRKEKEKKGMNSKTSDSKAEISKIGETRKEDVELDEAKMSVGDTVRIDPKSKNIVDRKKLGKSGYIKSKRGKDYLVKFADGSSVLAKSSDLEMVKEDSLGEAFEVLWNAIQEASEPKNRKGSATEPEGIMDKESPKSKEFADKHKKSDKDYEDMPKDAAEKTTKAGQAVKSQAPARSGDNMKGDKKVVNPVKEDTRSERNKIMDILSGKTWNEAREEISEAKGSTISFPTDLSKVRRAAPVKGLGTLKNNIAKALDQKFKSKLGKYELETNQRKNSDIVDVSITADQKLSKKDKTDIENHLVDKDLKIF